MKAAKRSYPLHISKSESINLPYSEVGIREYVKEKMRKYQGERFKNKYLKVYIYINRHSVREIYQKCANNRKAAELALYLPYILRNAKPTELHLPIHSNLQEIMGFKYITKMICNIKNVGIAKVVIGFTEDGKAILYSITNYQRLNKTNQFDF